MKKSIISVFLAVIVVSLCIFSISAPSYAAETFKFRLATHYNTQHPGYLALQNIVKEIDQKTNGAIKIKIYPSSQLGDYTLTYEDLMRGSVDMALIPIPSEFNTKLEMNFIPYLASSYAEMGKAFGPQSYFYKNYGTVHDKLGVKLLGICVEGLIGIVFTKLPDKYNVASAAKVSRVRAPAIEVYNLVVQDMGFSATTIPYADLYSSLQTGVCDGAIGLTPQLAYSDFRDIISHYVTYNIFVENIGFFMSKKVFEKMPANYKKIVEDAFMKEAMNSYKVAGELDGKALKDLEKYGVKIVNLSDKEMKAYVDQVKAKTWPKLSKNIGEDTLKALIDAMK